MTYLETLTRRALRVSIRPGGKLRIAPDWLITDDIRRMVREHRSELVREIMTSSASADASREIAPDYHSEQSDQVAKLEYMLAARGYAPVRSAIVDDIVVFVRDNSVVVPSNLADRARFSVDELRLMVGSAPEMVGDIHRVKRVFGGRVVPADNCPFGAGISATIPTAASAVQQLLLTSATPTDIESHKQPRRMDTNYE